MRIGLPVQPVPSNYLLNIMQVLYRPPSQESIIPFPRMIPVFSAVMRRCES